jgi:membrane protein DedA with SNARE-associated domain
MLLFISHLIGDSAGSMLLLSLAIVLCASVFEDLTMIVVGVLAADDLIPIFIAFPSIYVGILLGDIALYSLGRLARTHPKLARYVEHDFVASLRAWLENRYALTVFSASFIPGSRVPTYTASGFFKFPFSTFILSTIGGALVWTTFLFSATYWFSSLTARWLGPARWGIAGVLLLTLFFIGRHNLLVYRAKKEKSDAL